MKKEAIKRNVYNIQQRREKQECLISLPLFFSLLTAKERYMESIFKLFSLSLIVREGFLFNILFFKREHMNYAF